MARPESGRVGVSTPVLEGIAKVSGVLDYVATRAVPGALHAQVVRSAQAHALLRGIETKAASEEGGVFAVYTAADIRQVMPEPFYGPAFYDQPVLAEDRVRYVGEPVAVVLATTPETARRAASLVEVDYEPLPVVTDEVEAASAEAIRLHEQLIPGKAFADLRHLAGAIDSNVLLEHPLRSGDAEAALARAARVFEHEYRTQQVLHTPLESHVAIADPSEWGRIVVTSSTQSPSFVRLEIARLLGWDEARVHVRSGYLGGGFGAKLYTKTEPLAVACALLSGRVVRYALSMDEQFFMLTRHASTIRLRTGVDTEGRITARTVDVFWNGGAYADIGPRVTQKSGFVAAGPYRIPNVTIASRAVYTNRTPAGAMRGFGVPQVSFAAESQADEIAHALGMDPVSFRELNLLRPGDLHHSSTPLDNVDVPAVFQMVVERMALDRPVDQPGGPLRRGRGVACALKAVVTPTTSVATVHVAGDGSVSCHQSTVDVGQGSATAMAQIVAEELGLSPAAVTVLRPDTDANPYDMSTLGSRSTFHMGNAVRRAAEDARRQLVAMAAATTGTPEAEVSCAGGKIGGLDLRELMAAHFGSQAGTVIGRGTYTPAYQKPDPATGQSDKITAFWMTGAAGAEVLVDTETGRVTVERLVIAGDCGKAINPSAVRRQLSGAAVMQLGMTLSEEMVYDETGQLVNPGLAYYKVPTLADVPENIEVIIVEGPHPDGPYGAKGVGETGTLALSPAICNAVFDATGARIRELPLTPERVLVALKETTR